jgi:hypothetical protein
VPRMVRTAFRSPATTLAIVLATLITMPLADSLYRVPIQVSDSLEPIVIAAKYDSAQHLLHDSVTFSPTTFRPLRYLQARALLAFTQATGLTYHAVFRGVHVVLLLILIALFVTAVRVRNWPDLVAFTVAFPVLLGIHTFLSMLFEAFPVNHFAEVGVCAMALFVLAQHQARWFVPIVACVLLALTLSVIESGAMVWVTVICCAAAGLRGINRTTVIATTVVFAGYLLLRHVLGISSPGIGGHGSGFGDRFYAPEELAQRFGAHPIGFMIYNVTGGLASLLFAEPRQGVYALLAAWREGEIHPVVLINVISSSATTALLIWYAAARLPRRRSSWSDADRTFVAACAAVIVNAAFNAVYIKDEIMSPAGLFYAIATFVAVRALIDSFPTQALAATSVATCVLATVAALWTFRAVGVHYQLRYDAFTTRNDWVEVLRPDKHADWPDDPVELALTERLRAEAIARRTTSPSFMPRWTDRYWVE